MPKVGSSSSSGTNRQRRPALSPEARENQLISLAIDLAEKQLANGTASSQVISHYLKLGSTTARVEKEILLEQKKLIEAKTKVLASGPIIEELYNNAIKAMKTYSGNGDSDDH